MYVCMYCLVLLYVIQTDVVGDWAWGLKVPGYRQLCCCFVSYSPCVRTAFQSEPLFNIGTKTTNKQKNLVILIANGTIFGSRFIFELRRLTCCQYSLAEKFWGFSTI